VGSFRKAGENWRRGPGCRRLATPTALLRRRGEGASLSLCCGATSTRRVALVMIVVSDGWDRCITILKGTTLQHTEQHQTYLFWAYCEGCSHLVLMICLLHQCTALPGVPLRVWWLAVDRHAQQSMWREHMHSTKGDNTTTLY
jgi:hypothetical protein